MTKSEDPIDFQTIVTFLGDHHLLRVKVGESKAIPITIGNAAYEMRRMPGNITYSNYDSAIVDIRDDLAYGKSAGYTYVRAERDGCSCEFLIYVSEETPREWMDWKPYPEKEVVSFVPMIPAYTASLARKEMKQIRGMATYADGCRFELCGNDGVTYVNHTPNLFTIRPDGNVIPAGEIGSGKITVICGKCSFDIDFHVTE